MDRTPCRIDRRRFLGLGAGLLAARGLPLLPIAGCAIADRPRPGPLFSISLAQWSLHRMLRRGELDNLGFPKKAHELGIHAVEYVNSFWKDKARDADYLAELRRTCDGEGIVSLLIMCDGEGALGDPDADRRSRAIENHHRWVDAASTLGCHSIRVNAQSSGSYEEQQKLAADGLHRLCQYGDRHGIDVIVENHGGLSSNGRWLSETLRRADHPRCGALPDFGNFRIGEGEEYDRYQGVDELMPFARGVSAKSHDFDARGEETHTDYRRMLQIVVGKHGYRGHIGVEYEGDGLSEVEGIRATRQLLERVRDELTAASEGSDR
ncbi:MAG: sugar phosphate isomerase/epimerase [Planctomycetes bacterium]|nr:sugar phosphate isomerase/epimerase [Planctomycetota bacterium]